MFPDLTRDDVFRLETRRLWLRWPRAKDAPAIVRLAGERAVAEMTARIPHPIDPHGVDAFLLAVRRGNADGAGLTMAICLRSDPARLVGMVGIEGLPTPHLGYWLGTPHWGRGLMTEAACAMVEAFFAYARGTALASTARVDNPASRRVLEKCGFERHGEALQAFPARGTTLAVDLFRMERAEWERRERARMTERNG